MDGCEGPSQAAFERARDLYGPPIVAAATEVLARMLYACPGHGANPSIECDEFSQIYTLVTH